MAELELADGQNGFVASQPLESLGAGLSPIGDVDGDGTIDLAMSEVDNGNRGIVYVLFLNPDGTVRDQVEIGQGQGGFGSSISSSARFGDDIAELGDLDGDGIPDLAVSASFEDDGGFDTGTVWILFLNSDGTVKSEQKISNFGGGLPFTLDAGDHFGRALEGAGDFDGDGLVELFVGAPGDDDGGSDRGAVYILSLLSDGTVGSAAKISSTSGLFSGPLNNGGLFGTSVAFLGDLSGNGTAEIAVGHPFGALGGRAWILSISFDLVVGQVIVDNLNGLVTQANSGAYLGEAVESLGDLNEDGIPDLAVAAPRQHDQLGTTEVGLVWLLYLNPDGSVLAEQVVGPDQGGFQASLQRRAWFGTALANLGDLAGTGDTRFVIGAPYELLTSTAGSAHVVSLDFCPPAASAVVRNAGTNPQSYSAAAPVLGDTWVATVDLATTGHTFALIFGFSNPFQFTLGGGQTLLAIDGTMSGEVLGFQPQAGPLATFMVDVPPHPIYCGTNLYTQAIHYGGVTPFALSNAVDIELGSE